MDFIDLAAQQRRISEKLNANIAGVLAHGQYINDPEVRDLEKTLAAYVGVKHAVGCASGTDALLMALMALEIGPGDRYAILRTDLMGTSTLFFRLWEQVSVLKNFLACLAGRINPS